MIDRMYQVMTRINQIQKKFDSIQGKMTNNVQPAVKTDRVDIDNKKLSKIDIDYIIAEKSSVNSIPENLLKAVVDTESSYNQYAVSNKGAVGLMQLLPSTAKMYGYENIFKPENNIDAGAKHLKYLLKKYDGNFSKAIAAYNAGEGAVDKYDGIPPYKETQNYVSKVMQYYNNLNGANK